MTRLASPGERTRRRWRPRWWLVFFLGGPVIWYLEFWLVYLVAEEMCARRGAGPVFLGLALVSWMVLAATVVAAALIAWLAVKASQGPPGPGFRAELAGTGVFSGVVFALATVFVGLPALVLTPC